MVFLFSIQDRQPIGVQICCDKFLSGRVKNISLKGGKIIFSPTAAAFASPEKMGDGHLELMLLPTGFTFFRVNRVGSEENKIFSGRSFCISPEGNF